MVAVDPTTWAILAGVRFALVIIVASTHWTLVGDSSDLFFGLDAFGGLAAVFGFLVISGFSIAHSYAASPQQFFARRLARIYPTYLVYIAAWWFMFRFMRQDSLTTPVGVQIDAPTLSQTLQFGLMLQGATTVALLSPIWTLSIECWFYAATPLLAACRLSRLRALVLASAIAYYFIEPLSLTTLSSLRFGLAGILVGWAWLLGFLLYRTRLCVADSAMLLGVGGILLSRYAGGYQPFSVETYLGVCAALIFGRRINLGPRKSTILNYLGDLSYPLYLTHVPALCLCMGYFRATHSYVPAIVALLAAVTLLHVVDRPLRSRLRPLSSAIDPVKIARCLLMGLAFCCVAALAQFTGLAVLWVVDSILIACIGISVTTRHRNVRRVGYWIGTVGYIVMLGCAAYPQWTTYILSGPLPSAVDLSTQASTRAAHGFQEGWVVGKLAHIYLSVPRGETPAFLSVSSSIPPYLIGQVVNVTVDSHVLGMFAPSTISTEMRFEVPTECLHKVSVQIGLQMAKAASPPDTRDTRHLSLLVFAVSLDRGGQNGG